jgi:hypothetical protein
MAPPSSPPAIAELSPPRSSVGPIDSIVPSLRTRIGIGREALRALGEIPQTLNHALGAAPKPLAKSSCEAADIREEIAHPIVPSAGIRSRRRVGSQCDRGPAPESNTSNQHRRAAPC